MSGSLYPLEATGFYIDKYLAAYVHLSFDKTQDSVPKKIQEIIDNGQFDEMAKAGTLPLEFEYNDIGAAADILYPDDDNDPNQPYYDGTFSGFIRSALPEKTRNPIDAEIDEVDDDGILFIPAKKEPDLFKAPYPNPEMLMDEFQKSLSDLGVELPDDLDWWRYAVNITGQIFC